MFYLLEDNRIIEWNGDYIIKDTPKNINGVYKMKKCIIFKSETIKDGFVKKQSENVCDLIEVGDLVAQKKIFGYEEIYNISLVCGKDDKLIKCFYCTMFEDNVFAIYKPNSHGDYIKVWEKKDDN